MHRQGLSASVTQFDMSKYPSPVECSWSQLGAAVTAQRRQEEDWTMCYYFPTKLITANKRRLGLKDNRMITCDRKPFTFHPGHLSFCSNQESRENNKGDWCYQHRSDYSPFNLIILYYRERKDRKVCVGGATQDSHDLNSISSDQNVWQQSHCLWQTECEWNQARLRHADSSPQWQYEGKSSFCSDLFMQRSFWNSVRRMQNRHTKKIRCQRAAGLSHCAWQSTAFLHSSISSNLPK